MNTSSFRHAVLTFISLSLAIPTTGCNDDKTSKVDVKVDVYRRLTSDLEFKLKEREERIAELESELQDAKVELARKEAARVAEVTAEQALNSIRAIIHYADDHIVSTHAPEIRYSFGQSDNAPGGFYTPNVVTTARLYVTEEKGDIRHQHDLAFQDIRAIEWKFKMEPELDRTRFVLTQQPSIVLADGTILTNL